MAPTRTIPNPRHPVAQIGGATPPGTVVGMYRAQREDRSLLGPVASARSERSEPRSRERRSAQSQANYAVLATPRWLGLAVLAVLMAATMVGLGWWQLHRYHERSAVNARIDAAATADPVPLSAVVSASGAPGRAGPVPPPAAAWTRVRATGWYDSSHEILVRNRTLEGVVGFEVLTPLVQADGSAVLVDRGWVRASSGGAAVVPDVPPAPTGQATVVGPVRLPESRADPAVRRGDHVEVRRIDPARIAPALPYPLYGAYLTVDTQDPPAASLRPVPPEHQNALQNAGYVVQWWFFAAITLFGFGYLARREALQPLSSTVDSPHGVDRVGLGG
jgi:cytochrome oxidase assembly protein ShyY1